MPVIQNYYFKQYLLDYIASNLKVKRKPKYSNQYVLDIIWKVNACGICWSKMRCILTL